MLCDESTTSLFRWVAGVIDMPPVEIRLPLYPFPQFNLLSHYLSLAPQVCKLSSPNEECRVEATTKRRVPRGIWETTQLLGHHQVVLIIFVNPFGSRELIKWSSSFPPPVAALWLWVWWPLDCALDRLGRFHRDIIRSDDRHWTEQSGKVNWNFKGDGRLETGGTGKIRNGMREKRWLIKSRSDPLVELLHLRWCFPPQRLFWPLYWTFMATCVQSMDNILFGSHFNAFPVQSIGQSLHFNWS